jgi:hypothetical protein
MKNTVLLLWGFILPFFVTAQHYVFYLRGRIIEEQGIHAVDTVNGYGEYKYAAILDAFKKADLYKPFAEWVEPAIQWAKGKYD